MTKQKTIRDAVAALNALLWLRQKTGQDTLREMQAIWQSIDPADKKRIKFLKQ